MHSMYMLSDFHNLSIISTHNTFFQTGYHLEQLLKYMMLLPLPEMESVMANGFFSSNFQTHSMVKISSGSSTSSPKCKMLLVTNTLTLARAWIVRPKCRPYDTSGSVAVLHGEEL